MSGLPPSREEAFEKAMASFRDIDKRFGSDSPEYPSLDRMMGGYRGFAERVVGEAFLRIDSTISPLIESAAEGTDVAITDALLSNVRHTSQSDGTILHVATVLDNNGTPRFRLEFNPRRGHGEEDCIVSDIRISECPVGDPDYEFSDRIASAHVGRPYGDRGSDGHGSVEYSEFAKFVEAMDILRPFVSANLDKVERGKPIAGLGLSFSQINMINYNPALDFDGGLPGQLCLDVSDTMALSGAKRAFRFMAARLEDTIRGLAARGAVFGAKFLSLNDLDYMACAVPGTDGTPSAVLVTQANLIFEHDSFIAWSDLDAHGKPTKTTLVALKRGHETLDAVDAYMASGKTDGTTASYDHAEGTIVLPRDFMETSVLSTAPFALNYTLETIGDHEGEIENFEGMLRAHRYDEEIVANTPNAPKL
ncbi:hypothetical protein GOB57_21265 [Sinorhizobium meliloti]|nr:hypothetical protein [Sinorhizobium meliloti]